MVQCCINCEKRRVLFEAQCEECGNDTFEEM